MSKILDRELSDQESFDLTNLSRVIEGKQPLKITQVAHKLRRQREHMNNRLISWGEWTNRSPACNKSFARMVEAQGDVVAGCGYDHDLLSDFDSLMIEVDNLVKALKPIEQELCRLEYQQMTNGREQAWANRFGRSAGSYSNVKSRVLLRLSKAMGIK